MTSEASSMRKSISIYSDITLYIFRGVGKSVRAKSSPWCNHSCLISISARSYVEWAPSSCLSEAAFLGFLSIVTSSSPIQVVDWRVKSLLFYADRPALHCHSGGSLIDARRRKGQCSQNTAMAMNSRKLCMFALLDINVTYELWVGNDELFISNACGKDVSTFKVSSKSVAASEARVQPCDMPQLLYELDWDVFYEKQRRLAPDSKPEGGRYPGPAHLQPEATDS